MVTLLCKLDSAIQIWQSDKVQGVLLKFGECSLFNYFIIDKSYTIIEVSDRKWPTTKHLISHRGFPIKPRLEVWQGLHLQISGPKATVFYFNNNSLNVDTRVVPGLTH